jgi:hypothetical protein
MRRTNQTPVLIAGLVILAFLFAWFSTSNAQAPSGGNSSTAYANSQGTSSASHSVLAVAAPAYFFGAICTGTSASTAGFCEVFDANAVPADGAVTPAYCAAIPAGPGSTVQINAGLGGPYGTYFLNGIVVTFSTGVNCQTKTTTDGLIETVTATWN